MNAATVINATAEHKHYVALALESDDIIEQGLRKGDADLTLWTFIDAAVAEGIDDIGTVEHLAAVALHRKRHLDADNISDPDERDRVRNDADVTLWALLN